MHLSAFMSGHVKILLFQLNVLRYSTLKFSCGPEISAAYFAITFVGSLVSLHIKVIDSTINGSFVFDFNLTLRDFII